MLLCSAASLVGVTLVNHPAINQFPEIFFGYIVFCCNWMNLTLQCDESVGLRELPEIMLDWYLI